MRLLAKKIGVNAGLLYLENQQLGDEKNDPVRLKKMIQGCDWVFSKMGIEPDGNVVPCCWSGAVLGNIKEQSFCEIWYGKKYKNLRKLVFKGDTTYCKNCRRTN
jgi:MoaA/NifB/PqqE/SkfB family radical SAM enzyme